MNWIVGSAGKLTCYMVLAGSAFVVAMKAEDVSKFNWWQWTCVGAGLVGSLATTWRAFIDQTVSRKNGFGPITAEKKPDQPPTG